MCTCPIGPPGDDGGEVDLCTPRNDPEATRFRFPSRSGSSLLIATIISFCEIYGSQNTRFGDSAAFYLLDLAGWGNMNVSGSLPSGNLLLYNFRETLLLREGTSDKRSLHPRKACRLSPAAAVKEYRSSLIDNPRTAYRCSETD